jgi:hypothetical protein
MMKTIAKIGLFLLAAVLGGLTGCIREEQYPIVPRIEYGGFATARDQSGKDSLGALTISYTDGDGNIGLYSWDTVVPYKYNFYLKFMQYHNRELIEVKPADTSLSFNSRIPLLTPPGRNKNIKGEITMYLELYFARQALLTDTIAFEVYIVDRDLNASNVVQSPLYIIRK